MSKSMALRRARNRQKPDVLREREMEGNAFMWAWDKLEGWGDDSCGEWKKLNYNQRIAKARQLATWAMKLPLLTLSDTPPRIKRWKGRETAA